jgi:hypothetical protein
MRRKLCGIRPVAGPVAAAAAALAVALSGCGSSGAGSAAQSGASPSGAAGSSPGDSLALSHIRVLTRLKSAELCRSVSTARAARILGARTATPSYAVDKGLGISCSWARRGAAAAGADELYVGISSVLDWSGAQLADGKLLTVRRLRVDGHPALAGRPRSKDRWAQVDVALGGDHDPSATYRAPTLTAALAGQLCKRMRAAGDKLETSGPRGVQNMPYESF